MQCSSLWSQNYKAAASEWKLHLTHQSTRPPICLPTYLPINYYPFAIIHLFTYPPILTSLHVLTMGTHRESSSSLITVQAVSMALPSHEVYTTSNCTPECCSMWCMGRKIRIRMYNNRFNNRCTPRQTACLLKGKNSMYVWWAWIKDL